MKKIVKIVTVPTGKQGWNKGDIVVIHGKAMISDSDTPDWHNLATKWSAKQLLVLSDDEIKDGIYYKPSDKSVRPYRYTRTPLTEHEGERKKIIASYPHLPDTLPLSKETVQAWIDAGTPEEGSVNMLSRKKRNVNITVFSSEKDWKEYIADTDTQGNLLLEFTDREINRS